MSKHILVAGAGIVGVSTAIWLQRAGHRVTIVDRQGPAAGASFGNAGLLASIAVVPVPTPGLWRTGLQMLFDKNAPLFIRWRYLPRLLPFLARYMAHASASHVEHCAAALTALQYDSYEQHLALAKDTPAAQYLFDTDYFFAYQSAAALKKEQAAWDLRARLGHRFEQMTGEAFGAYDPLYEGRFAAAVRCLNHGRISDPGAYVQALADHFVSQGGALQIAEITDVEMAGDRCTGLVTDEGRMSADHVVLALGAWSAPVAEKLGLKRLSFESERGYHIELINPDRMPRASTMISEGKFVISPMDGRIRCAGVVEFGGLKAPPSDAPGALLRRQARALLDDRLLYERVDEWMGHRPATSDSLPLVGPVNGDGSAYAAFGHQHVGLTGGPKSGRLIADMISGRTPNTDMSAYDPQRYA